MQTLHEQALVLAVVLVNGSCFGVSRVVRLFNDQIWHVIPADAFKACHWARYVVRLAATVNLRHQLLNAR